MEIKDDLEASGIGGRIAILRICPSVVMVSAWCPISVLVVRTCICIAHQLSRIHSSKLGGWLPNSSTDTVLVLWSIIITITVTSVLPRCMAYCTACVMRDATGSEHRV